MKFNHRRRPPGLYDVAWPSAPPRQSSGSPRRSAAAWRPRPAPPTPPALTGVVLGVGANESQRVVTWYSSADTAQVGRRSRRPPTLVDGEFPADAVTFPATVAANIASTAASTATPRSTGLQENTAYSYRVGAEGAWSPTYSFKTQDFEGDFDFLFFGDPQIGSSGNVAEGRRRLGRTP